MSRFNFFATQHPVAAAVTVTTATIDRDSLITQIANACRRPCPPVRPSLSFPGKFSYFDEQHNTYFGPAHDTEAAAIAAWTAAQDQAVASFATTLRAMDDTQLKSQADYWLKPTAPAPPVKPVSSSAPVTATIKAATHTKRQCPIWIVQLSARVERAEFLRLSKLAKKHVGYYSSYGPMEMHGFIFFTEANAQTFAESGLGQPATAAPLAHRPEPTPTNIIPLPKPSTFDLRPSTAPSTAPAMPAWRARLLRRPLSVGS